MNGSPRENCTFFLLTLYSFRSVHPHASFSKSQYTTLPSARVFAKIHTIKFSKFFFCRTKVFFLTVRQF